MTALLQTGYCWSRQGISGDVSSVQITSGLYLFILRSGELETDVIGLERVMQYTELKTEVSLEYCETFFQA